MLAISGAIKKVMENGAKYPNNSSLDGYERFTQLVWDVTLLCIAASLLSKVIAWLFRTREKESPLTAEDVEKFREDSAAIRSQLMSVCTEMYVQRKQKEASSSTIAGPLSFGICIAQTESKQSNADQTQSSTEMSRKKVIFSG